ncbi:MAG: hypothetical protein KAI26_05790 [Nanoarchaeota archaeon]|nr:hypothetical protein [Nanoarchaeota archaeon]
MKKEDIQTDEIEKESVEEKVDELSQKAVEKESSEEEKADGLNHEAVEEETSEEKKVDEPDQEIVEEETSEEDKSGKDLKSEETESQKVIAKSPKRNIKIILVLIAIIVIAALLYKGNQYYEEKKEYDATHKVYHYYTFENDEIHWKTTWINNNQPYILNFRHWPGELEDIKIIGKLNSVFSDADDVYLTFDADGENFDYLALAATEISLNINQVLGKNIFAACIANNTPDCYMRPIVTCEDRETAVIFLRVAENPQVILSGNCMTLEGTDEELVMAAERVLYAWYGIMQVQ